MQITSYIEMLIFRWKELHNGERKEKKRKPLKDFCLRAIWMISPRAAVFLKNKNLSPFASPYHFTPEKLILFVNTIILIKLHWIG